jgi:DNA-binding transcriptional MerR regulator
VRTLPFGYRAKGDGTVTDPAEQKALAVIRRLRSKGQSLRDIEQALIDQGHKPRAAKEWNPGILRRILAADRGGR